MVDRAADVRWTVYFSGHVQGVGFRYTTQRAARGFEVTGYVRNLPDGRVELVAEGQNGEIERFIQAVETQMGGHVHERKAATSPVTGKFEGFQVRH